jgi:hypothetical protein
VLYVALMTDRYLPFRLDRGRVDPEGRAESGIACEAASSATRARHGRASAWCVHVGIDFQAGSAARRLYVRASAVAPIREARSRRWRVSRISAASADSTG